MQNRLEQIIATIDSIEGVTITVPFTQVKSSVKGMVMVTVGEHTESFETIIEQQYPFQFHNVETIRFINKELIIKNHVNNDGSICVHTLHSPNIERKLILDFTSLKEWMKKYLIENTQESHYEHIVVPLQESLGRRHVMLFTDINNEFKSGDFGNITFSYLDQGKVTERNLTTYLLQSVILGKNELKCAWNSCYKSMPTYEGIFLYLDNPPARHGRFMVDNWDELNGVLPQNFVDFIASTEQALKKENYGKISFLLGYPIKGGTVHWQLINIEKNNFPVFTDKIAGARRMHITRLKKQAILWGETRNCSYDHFFGRGAFCKKFTDAKILILGLGAVGSMVAQTLCRSGCLKIDLVDYDAKEPENVCRSEYFFHTGVNDKVSELRTQLHNISPFIETSGNSLVTDAAKTFRDHPDAKRDFQDYFNGYDIIFDCSADNDLAYLISQFDLRSDVVNLSITNHAQELVCTVNPNLYHALMHIFNILKSDTESDLYNPTGCWSPTFKASYNDIAVLVQFALKQINLSYKKHLEPRSFYLSSEESTNFNIKMTPF